MGIDLRAWARRRSAGIRSGVGPRQTDLRRSFRKATCGSEKLKKLVTPNQKIRSIFMANQRKPSIVFVHGLWADGSCFAKLIPTLQKEGFEVIASQHGLDSHGGDVA